jgi:hypothetical protein
MSRSCATATRTASAIPRCPSPCSVRPWRSSVAVELLNIPRDQSDTIRDLQDEIYGLRAKLSYSPSQETVDFWRNRCGSLQRELNEFRAKHAPDDLKDLVRTFRSSGNKISAIKAVREKTYWGLKESKDFVDAVWDMPAIEQAVPDHLNPEVATALMA